MVILGGAGTLVGPALGAALIVLLENVISNYTQRWLMVLGAIYVVVTLFAPRGLVGLVQDLRETPMTALQVRQLYKRFGGIDAVAGVSLDVAAASGAC